MEGVGLPGQKLDSNIEEGHSKFEIPSTAAQIRAAWQTEGGTRV